MTWLQNVTISLKINFFSILYCTITRNETQNQDMTWDYNIYILLHFAILDRGINIAMLQSYYCYFNKCFKREYSKDGWLVASKPKICGDYKAGTFLLYNIYMAGNINSQSQKQQNKKRELLGPGLQGYTKHSISPKPAEFPAHHDAASATKLLDAFEVHTDFNLFLPFWIKCCATCCHIKVSSGIAGPEAIWSVYNTGIKKWHFCKALLPLQFHSWTHMSWSTPQDDEG